MQKSDYKMINELAEKIWEHKQFHQEYNQLTLNSLRSELQTEVNIESTGSLDTNALHRLLQSASHLAGCSRSKYREAAYRIAVASLNLYSDEFPSIVSITNSVLTRLGNFPASLFLHNKFENFFKEESIPIPLWIDTENHRIQNTVEIGNGNSYTLTDFQRNLWNALEIPEPVAVSAPTSAGKSYAMIHYLAKELIKNPTGWILYLVPTRALISQVQHDINATLASISESGHIVSSIPVTPEELGANKGVYVLTQERAQLLLELTPHIEVPLVIVDEAQGVNEDSRGIILQTVLENILNSNNKTKCLFAAPLISNPGVFSKIFNLTNLKDLQESENPVSQNLIFTETNPVQKNRITFKIKIEDSFEEICTVNLPHELFDNDQKLSTISWDIGHQQQNLVYSSGPANCEKVASLISELANNENSELDEELSVFSRFIKDHVHSDYSLASTVLNGVGFHYGNMPAVIRLCLEDLFKRGKLQYIVCTSTLLQGVNLPAKNLFLLNPTKGKDWETAERIPLSPVEFWNLAGRAGRLGKEFEGNVFLVDYEHWKEKPVDGEKEHEISSSLQRNVVAKQKDLLDFIKDKEHPSGLRKNLGLESTFVKLYNHAKEEKLPEILDRLFENVDQSNRNEIETSILETTKEINISDKIARRNITVSVYRQQEMLNYLLNRIDRGSPLDVIPIHPLRPESYNNLIPIFKRIHNHFEHKKKGDRSHVFFATLALNWMRGKPLPLLIDSSYKYKMKNAKRPPSIATVIRDTLKSIEQDIRFRYVKYVRCYIDLVEEALKLTKNDQYIDSIPPLNLYLELGASSNTMVNLIGLGMTRTSASIISEESVNKKMTREESLSWLQNTNWSSKEIPSICHQEIKNILSE